MKKLLSVILVCALCATFSIGTFALDLEGTIGDITDTLTGLPDTITGYIDENPIPEDASGIVTSILDQAKELLGSSDIGGVVETLPDVDSIIEILKSTVDTGSISDVVDESVASLEDLGLISGDFDISSLDTDLVPQFMDGIFAGLEALGVDTTGLEQYLTDSELINFFASLYTGGGTVDPVIPQTGSSATGLAALVVLAIAAGTTAVVCTKKKED